MMGITSGIEVPKYQCCICGRPKLGYGNNPWPIANSGKCCDPCNYKYVVRARQAFPEITPPQLVEIVEYKPLSFKLKKQ